MNSTVWVCWWVAQESSWVWFYFSDSLGSSATRFFWGSFGSRAALGRIGLPSASQTLLCTEWLRCVLVGRAGLLRVPLPDLLPGDAHLSSMGVEAGGGGVAAEGVWEFIITMIWWFAGETHFSTAWPQKIVLQHQEAFLGLFAEGSPSLQWVRTSVFPTPGLIPLAELGLWVPDSERTPDHSFCSDFLSAIPIKILPY